jgi:glutamate N-acetyltransferase/amino-acid N-acetyltransferase
MIASMKMRMIRNGGLSRVKGLRAAGIACGIKTPGKRDLALVIADRPASVAATFTTNLVQAAPVRVSKRHLRRGRFSAIVLNSGNANACTGPQGLRDAEAMARTTARLLACPIEEVFVASTGVIGRPMPMAKIQAGIAQAVRQLSPEGGADAAQAIMTTDTTRKEVAVSFAVDGQRVTVAGMAKGSGMIAPNMATMLAVVATDAGLTSPQLQRALGQAVAASFNCITVDGDTSTNDMVLGFATGAAGAPRLLPGTAAFRAFQEALEAVCLKLAKAIARDGEGATKLAGIVVRGGRTAAEARRGAEAVATSPLVKTTLAGEDINWGRILAALGRSGARFDPERVDVAVDGAAVVRRGCSLGSRAEAAANRRLRRAEYTISIDLHAGAGLARLWTTDLTEAYVRINAGYRS